MWDVIKSYRFMALFSKGEEGVVGMCVLMCHLVKGCTATCKKKIFKGGDPLNPHTLITGC